jgi:hypothetical protein
MTPLELNQKLPLNIPPAWQTLFDRSYVASGVKLRPGRDISVQRFSVESKLSKARRESTVQRALPIFLFG